MRQATISSVDLAEALKKEFGYLMFGSQRIYDKKTWLDIADTILDTIDPMGETDPASPYYDPPPNCPAHHGRDRTGRGCLSGSCPNSTGPDIGT